MCLRMTWYMNATNFLDESKQEVGRTHHHRGGNNQALRGGLIPKSSSSSLCLHVETQSQDVGGKIRKDGT